MRAERARRRGLVTALDLDRQPLRVLGLDPLSEAPFRGHLGGGRSPSPPSRAFFTDPKAVLVGAALAERYGLAPGSPLRVRVAATASRRSACWASSHAAGAEEAGASSTACCCWTSARAQRPVRMGDRVSPHRPDPATGRRRSPRIAPPPPRGRARRAGERAGVDRRPAHRRLRAEPHRPQPARPRGGHVPHLQHRDVQRRAAARGVRHAAHCWARPPGQLFALDPRGDGGGLRRGHAARPRPRLAARARRAVRLVTPHDQRPLLRRLRHRGAAHRLRRSRRPWPSASGPACSSAVAPGPRGRARRARRGPAPQHVRRRARGASCRGSAPRAPSSPRSGGCCSSPRGALARRELRRALRDRPGPGPARPRSSRSALMALGAPVAGRFAGHRWAGWPRGTVARSVSRTGVAAAALMVAVSVTIGVGVMIESFRSTVENWLDLTLRADVYRRRAVGRRGARRSRRSPRTSPARVAAVPGSRRGRDDPLRARGEPARRGATSASPTRAARATRASTASPRATRSEPGTRVRAGAVIVTRAVRLPPPAARRAADRSRCVPTAGPRTFPVAGRLLRLRDRAGHRLHDPQGLRALLGRPRRHLGRRATSRRARRSAAVTRARCDAPSRAPRSA